MYHTFVRFAQIFNETHATSILYTRFAFEKKYCIVLFHPIISSVQVLFYLTQRAVCRDIIFLCLLSTFFVIYRFRILYPKYRTISFIFKERSRNNLYRLRRIFLNETVRYAIKVNGYDQTSCLLFAVHLYPLSYFPPAAYLSAVFSKWDVLADRCAVLRPASEFFGRKPSGGHSFSY